MEIDIPASPTCPAQLLPVPSRHGHRHAAAQQPSQHIGRLLQAQRLQGKEGTSEDTGGAVQQRSAHASRRQQHCPGIATGKWHALLLSRGAGVLQHF